MTKTNMTNTNIRIRCRTVGQNFGTVGQIVARNGRVVAETRTFPYGFTGPATDAARSLAATKGWTVRS